MNTKNLVRTKWLDIELYYEGICIGMFFDTIDRKVVLIIPFLILEIKYWSLKRRRHPNEL